LERTDPRRNRADRRHRGRGGIHEECKFFSANGEQVHYGPKCGAYDKGVGVVVKKDCKATEEANEHGASASPRELNDSVCETLSTSRALEKAHETGKEPGKEDYVDMVLVGKRLDDVRIQSSQKAAKGVVAAYKNAIKGPHRSWYMATTWQKVSTIILHTA
jgi:hypothetical protein